MEENERGPHTARTFRAEFRTKAPKWVTLSELEGWRSYHGPVRLPQDDGAITKPTTVSESVENIREAITQWDSVERYEWRVIGRETTWHEWEVTE